MLSMHVVEGRFWTASTWRCRVGCRSPEASGDAAAAFPAVQTTAASKTSTTIPQAKITALTRPGVSRPRTWLVYRRAVRQ